MDPNIGENQGAAMLIRIIYGFRQKHFPVKRGKGVYLHHYYINVIKK